MYLERVTSPYNLLLASLAPKRLFNEAPDEFFTPPPGFGAHHITMKDSNNPLNNYRFQNSHLPPGSDGPPFTSSPPSRMPDTSKLNISDDPMVSTLTQLSNKI